MIPEVLFELKNLTDLSIFGSQIKSIPKGIKQMRKLESLCLSGSALTIVPKELFQMPKLKFFHTMNSGLSNEQKAKIKKWAKETDCDVCLD